MDYNFINSFKRRGWKQIINEHRNQSEEYVFFSRIILRETNKKNKLKKQVQYNSWWTR